MSEKLILPAEVKVCATCTYWDGERQVDDDLQVVVVDCECEGECLVQEKILPALHDTRQEHICDWADLGGEGPASPDLSMNEEPSTQKTTKDTP